MLRKGSPHIHKARLESLCDVVRAALSATSHTLSNLARALDTKKTRATGTATAVRHRVKRVDRLLGSCALQQERASIYAAMAQFWRGAVRLSGASRLQTGKPDIFRLIPRGWVLPRDFTLGLAAISASTLSGQIWRCSGGLKGEGPLAPISANLNKRHLITLSTPLPRGFS